jgi:hypothetical protein
MAGLALSLKDVALRRYEGSPAWRLVHPRRFHAYCVGTGKSGTHSIAGMFRAAYRTAHEPETGPLIDVIVAELEGRMAGPAVARWLRRRDRRLWLEMDSSGLNAAVIGHLVALFPEARFVLTIRDCYTWLDSLLNHQLTRQHQLPPQIAASWRKLREARYPPAVRVYSPGEEVLQENGLYPIGAYLKQWASQNRTVLKTVPPDRLLVLRTDGIGDSAGRLAAFLGIPPDTVDGAQAHLYRRNAEAGMLARIDRSLIEERVAEHCRELMGLYFPEIPDMTSAGLR